MRLFLIALLLANAVYFAWSQQLLTGLGVGPASQREPQRVAQQVAPDALRLLSATESDIAMMWTQGAVMLAASLVALPFVATPVPDAMWGVIAVLAAVLIAGQALSFRAMRLAPVGAVAPLQYTELVWAAAFGWIFWNEWPSANVWWGALVVVSAGLYTIWRERVRAAQAVEVRARQV